MKFGLFTFFCHFMVYKKHLWRIFATCGKRKKAGAKGTMGFSWKK
jgi:hypothetical protein